MPQPGDFEALRRQTQEFLYAVSHDLAEPFRKVRAFGQRLAAKLGDRLDDAARDDLERMLSAAARGQGMIEGLLILSRIETDGGPFAEVNVNQAVAGALDDLEETVRATGARVEIGPLPALNADAAQLRLLFAALLDNALKFRRPGAAPVIRVAAEASTDSGTCRIVVEDNGIGFDPQQAERIFAIFQRLHPRDVYPGLGLGLTIARKIAERHGGSLQASTVSPGGSRFTLALPTTP